MTRPRISFFGSSLVSAYWNGAATYYRGIIRALHERGYDVTFYEPDAYERQQHRDIPDPDWARVVVYAPTDEGVARAFEEGSSADIVVKTSGVGIFDELLEAAVASHRRPGSLSGGPRPRRGSCRRRTPSSRPPPTVPPRTGCRTRRT